MPDLALLRRDPAAFAGEALGSRLVGWQEAELRASVEAGLISCWLWGRQSGKSTSLAVLALWAGFAGRDRRVLVLSGGGDLGARRLLETARGIAGGSPLLAGSVVEESGSILRLSNGSEVRALSALSEHALRGWSADALLIDEPQLAADDRLLSAALPTVLARPGAFVVLAGTAGRSDGAFYDLFRAGEVGAEGVRSSRRVSRLVGGSDEMPWQSATMVARLMEAMGPVRAGAEFRCEWASGSDRLFSREELERVTADYRPDTLAGMRGPGAVWAGLDLGLSSDRSALVALGRPILGTGAPRVLAVRCAYAWPPRHPLMAPDGGEPGVFEEVAASPAVLQVVRVDATGMQAGFLQYLTPLLRRRLAERGGGRPRSRVVMVEEDVMSDRPPRPRRPAQGVPKPVLPTSIKGVAFTAAMKQASYAQLRALVQRERLLIPAAATELIRELLLLEVGLTKAGSETFEAASGGHDDLADALVLSLAPYRHHDRTWRTRAGDVVDLPDPVGLSGLPSGAWAGGRTVTGGGVEVPVLPCWASPAGAALTVPEQVADWRAPLDPAVAATARRITRIVNREAEVQ